ncbi:MAG: lactonase family protein [Bacteroidales bacterium]|nr:lactonase family protein [Bacteroidales bacterium]
MKEFRRFLSVLIITSFLISSGCREDTLLFVGGYTQKPYDKGLSIYEFDSRNGRLNLFLREDAGPNPSFFHYDKENGLLYAVNEVMNFEGEFGGGLMTLKYNKLLNRFDLRDVKVIPYGGPCHISVSADKEHLFVANYPNGSIAVIRLDDNGIPQSISDTILFVKGNPDISHAHMIKHDPAGRKVYVTDTGLDRIYCYDFDPASGKLVREMSTTFELAQGSGPRHFVFNDDGSRMYVINETGSTVMVYDVDEKGALSLLQTLPTVREDFFGDNYCADIHFGKSGKFLYGSNRGENTIVTYKVIKGGLLKLAGHTPCGGKWPRNFTIDPSGKYLVVGNQESETISVFKISRIKGLPKEPSTNYDSRSPACLKFY